MNEDFTKALTLFDLTEPYTREALDQKRRELLATWNPHRYANLTNNPKKYMKSYKQGEEKTREINAAYEVLAAKLKSD